MPISLNMVDCYIHAAEPPPDPVSLLPKRAIEFDRTKSQYAWIPHNKAYENLTQFTLNMWIMPKSAPVSPGYAAFIEKDYGATQSVGVYQDPNGYFHAGINTGNVWNAQNSLTIPSLNKWYMVTLRYDGSTCKLYVNGVEQGGFAKTGPISMSTEHWWIAHRPNTGQYLSFVLAELEMWNYALTLAEIAARYSTPDICTYKLAYIPVGDLQGDVFSHKSAHISSVIGGTNPLTVRSSIGAMISIDGKTISKGCFISSGTSQITEFDMVTDVQNRSEVSFDTIVFIRGGITKFNEYVVGRIEYPLTRNATRPLTIYTKDVPGQTITYQDCYIMRHNILSEASKFAHIVVGESSSTSKNVFISGLFQSKYESRACYINGELRVSKDSYISGSLIFNTPSSKDVYINSEDMENISTNIQSYIVGPGPHVSIQAYIHVSNGFVSQIGAYIHDAEPDTIGTYRYSYVYGAGVFRRNIYAYIEGILTDRVTKLSYIVTNPVESSSIQIYINSSLPRIGNKWMHIMANAPKSSSKNIFIHANLNKTEVKSSFINGRISRESSRRLFINSQGLASDRGIYISGRESRTASITSFIAANYSARSKMCHISGGDSQAFKPLFINGTDRILAYIEGTRLSSSTKGAFIRSLGTREATRRSYIQGT